MRWQAKDPLFSRYREHPAFAWLPVKTREGMWLWLEVVNRRCCSGREGDFYVYTAVPRV